MCTKLPLRYSPCRRLCPPSETCGHTSAASSSDRLAARSRRTTPATWRVRAARHFACQGKPTATNRRRDGPMRVSPSVRGEGVCSARVAAEDPPPGVQARQWIAPPWHQGPPADTEFHGYSPDCASIALSRRVESNEQAEPLVRSRGSLGVTLGLGDPSAHANLESCTVPLGYQGPDSRVLAGSCV